MKEDWCKVNYKDVVLNVSTSKKKLKQKEYLSEGKIPVVDQGQELIGGYTDDDNRTLNCMLPVIVFGDHTKIVKLINFAFAPGADGTKILEVRKPIEAKFLYYLTKVLAFKISDKGYARHYQYLEKEYLPLAPLPIQRAIVKKIEELFSSLDSGIADLKKAQEQLVIYRQAVLKKAFEGELTKEWREIQTNLPTADELLEQIKEERQRFYEQQIADWKEAIKLWDENGKEGRKPNKPQKTKKFKEITSEEYSKLPSLPSTWSWNKFGNVCLKIMDGTHYSPKNSPDGDFKYITAKNIKEGRIELNKLSYVSKKDHQEIYSRCDVKKGDVLYIKDGATTGRAAINNFDEEFSLLSSVGVFRTSHNLISPKYLEYYLNAQITRNRMLSNIAGVAITRLTLVKLNNSEFIICSQKEQSQIVREIESRLSVCDKVEESITESLEKAQACAKAFSKKPLRANC